MCNKLVVVEINVRWLEKDVNVVGDGLILLIKNNLKVILCYLMVLLIMVISMVIMLYNVVMLINQVTSLCMFNYILKFKVNGGGRHNAFQENYVQGVPVVALGNDGRFQNGNDLENLIPFGYLQNNFANQH